MAACIRTVLAMRGEPVPEEPAVLVALGAPRYGSFDRAQAFGGYLRLRIDVDVDVLLGYAERVFACIIVGRPAYENGESNRLVSPHGEMPRGHHHAIVVTALDGEHFTYLDPWFPRAGQPLRVPVVDFVRDWWVSGLLGV